MRKPCRFLIAGVSLSFLGTGLPAALATPWTAAGRVNAFSRQLQAAMAQSAPSAQGPVADAIATARSEQDPLLHRMMVSNLVRQKMPLLREQKKEILRLVRDETRGLLPKVPPIPKQGTVEIRHYAMSGFLEPDMQHLREAGFQVTTRPGGAEATRGRLHVVLRQGHKDILRDLADPSVHMLVYNGHSQIGGVVEQALQQPQLRGPDRRKLVALFQCIGTQTLPFLKTALPRADVITSDEPLYISETPHLVQALYEAVDKGDSYHQMRRRLERAGRRNSLVFPNQSVNLKHVDFEANGSLDIHDRKGIFQMLQGPARDAATGLMSGVHFLTSMNPYYVDESTNPVFRRDQAKVPLVARGMGPGDGRSVAQITPCVVNGQRRFDVTLDPNYRTESRAFVGAASVFDVQMCLQKEFTGRDGLREKIRALCFAADYLDLIPRNRYDAQNALNRVCRMNGLPSNLDLWTIQSALGGHVVNESAVDRLEQIVRTSQPRSPAAPPPGGH